MVAPMAAVLGALALGGCVHERSKSIGLVREGALAPPPAADANLPESAWSDRAFGRRRSRSDERPVRDPRSSEAPSVDRPAGPPPAAIPASVELPPDGRATGGAVRESAAPPAHRPMGADESLDERARTKFLASATEVSAERATLYVPRALAGEVVRVSASVVTLRRLTVRAGQLAVVVRDDNADLQLSARGGVSFRSDQPASILEESGLRSLLLKNDGYTPLR